MIALFTSIPVAIFVFLYGKPLWDILLLSALFFPLSLLLKAFSWHSLSKMEQNSIPKVLSLSSQDKVQKALLAWFALFPLISIGIASYGQLLGFAIWIVIFGITLDLLFFFSQRLERMLDPFFGLEELEKKAILAIQEQKIQEALDWIDFTAEAGMQACTKGRSSLAIKSLDVEEKINHALFANAPLYYETMQKDEEDLISYALFYLYQRLDLLFNLALKDDQEVLCSKIIAVFGKAILNGGKSDLTFANDPIHSLGRLAKEALKKNDSDLVLKALLTFVESAKLLLKEVDARYGNLKEPFVNLIEHMRSLSQEIFRNNRQTNLSLLIEPFRELKQIFQSDKLKNHQDTPLIVYNLDQVIGEFEALELLLKTIPPIPDLEPESAEKKG